MASNSGYSNPPSSSGFQVPRTPIRRQTNEGLGGDDGQLPVVPLSRAERMKDSSQRFATQMRSTPRRTEDTRDDAAGQSTKLIGKTLKKTLGEPTTSDNDWILNGMATGDVLDPDTVTSWLDNATSDSVYKGSERGFGKRWHLIDPAPTSEEGLYDGVVDTINAILRKFVLERTGSGVRRLALDTHDKKFIHKDPGENSTSPDIMVRATGPSFQIPKDDSGRDYGYSNAVTFIDVKLDENIGASVHIDQLAVYARQIFAYQPNRRFVRCFLISEKHIKLVQFDAAGTQTSELIDINAYPDLFVILLATACCADEYEVGLDDTIWWKIVGGRKVEGTLRTLNEDGEEITYHLEDVEPTAHDYDFHGRATTCWTVRHPVTDELLVIKDTWSSEGRTAEREHLVKAIGLPGVCQIVAHEERWETCDFRCPSTLSLFFNRVAERITMEAYGERIDRFKDPLQLLEALRDIVDAHAYLYEHDILHRDISTKNILLGRDKAPDGFKGILIDLSVALDFGPNGDPTVTKEARPGSRFFQSCIILGFLTKLRAGEPPAHDYLDDLEAVFYVLCGILFKKLPNGRDRKLKSKARNVVKNWDSETAQDALQTKALLFNPGCTERQVAIELVEKSWGPVCAKLFASYLEWVYEIQQKKAGLIREFRKTQIAAESDESESEDDECAQKATARSRTNPTMDQGVFTPLLLHAGKHYDDVLGIFTLAIASLRAAAGLPGPRVPKRRESKLPKNPNTVTGFGHKAARLL